MTNRTGSRLVLRADHQEMRQIGPWLADLLRPGSGNDAPRLHARLELALHEVCVNVVDHSYECGPGDITVEGWVDGGWVNLRVTDAGAPFDTTSVVAPQPDVPQIRGYGLMIVKQLVDEMRYERQGDTNVWTLSTYRIAGPVPDPATGMPVPTVGIEG